MLTTKLLQIFDRVLALAKQFCLLRCRDRCLHDLLCTYAKHSTPRQILNLIKLSKLKRRAPDEEPFSNAKTINFVNRIIRLTVETGTLTGIRADVSKSLWLSNNLICSSERCNNFSDFVLRSAGLRI